MGLFISMTILIAVLLIGIVYLISSILNTKEKRRELIRTGKYPEGHFMILGVALGIPLGILIGYFINDIPVGPAIGVVIGLGIGLLLERRNIYRIRALNHTEKVMKNWVVLIVAIIILIAIIAIVIDYFFLKL